MTSQTQADDYLSIATPENVAFGYTIAGLGSRFLAALVDTLIILVLQLLVNVTLILIVVNIFDVQLFSGELDQTAAWAVGVLGLIAFGFFWGYYIFFEMLWNGQSPGKRLIGLRVIRKDGTPITLTEAIVRNLIRLIDFLPAYYGVGVVAIFVDGQSRRLGDMAAGTLVVRDRAAITLESLAGGSRSPVEPASGAEAAAARWPVNRLSSRERELAEEFLRRRDTLPNRAVLAKKILAALYRQMEMPVEPDDDEHAEDVIVAIVQATRSNHIG
jgi:uncharacterized RDD family membrane protein YckC